MRNKKLAFSFEVGEPIDDESGTYRRHRLSCELNVVYLVVGCGVAAALVILGTLLYFGHGYPETNQNSFITEAPNANAIVDAETNYRLEYVRNLTRDEWNVHLQFHLTEGLTNQTWHNSSNILDLAYGYVVIQAMSTLWVVNLQEEFAHAKTWIKPFIELSSHPSVSGIVTQYVGSLESCYALSGDESFLNEAKEAVNVLKKAHEPNGLPWHSAIADSSTYHDSNNCRLDQLSSYLEYRYMADLTHDSQLDTILSKYRTILKSWPKTNELYNLERTKVNAVDSLNKFFYHSKLFYSYLIKSYIQSNYTDHESNSMFNQALETAGLIVNLNDHSEKGSNDNYCYLGAMLGLSAWAKNQSRVDAVLMKKHWNWAVQFTEKCHSAFSLNYTQESKSNYSSIIQKGHFISPHLAECYFVLYRLTGDPKYREYAWELAQNIHNYRAKVGKLFTGWSNIFSEKFMKSSFKYLYLIFSEDNLLSLDAYLLITPKTGYAENSRGQVARATAPWVVHVTPKATVTVAHSNV